MYRVRECGRCLYLFLFPKTRKQACSSLIPPCTILGNDQTKGTLEETSSSVHHSLSTFPSDMILLIT